MITKDNYYCASKKKFNSLGEFLDKIKDDSFYAYLKNNRSSQDLDHMSYSWYMTKTFQEAIDLAIKGWPPGLEASLKLTEKYKNIFESCFPKQDYAQETIHAVEGEFVDIERAIAGIPESMIKFCPSETIIKPGNKLQRIFINCGFHSSVSGENVFYRGSVITALINTMELCGFRTEITLRQCADKNYNNSYTKTDIVVKQFDENLDLDKIAFCLAHPSFHRRLMFANNEQNTTKIVDDFGFILNGSYSSSNDLTFDLNDNNDLYLNFLPSSVSSFESCVAFVIEELKRHFGELIVTE